MTWWETRFAGRTLAEITPDRVAEARDVLAAEKFTRGKVQKKKGVEIAPTEDTRKGATVNRYLATLSHMFTMAVKEWRLVPTNPVRDITKKKEARGRVRSDRMLNGTPSSPLARSPIGRRCIRLCYSQYPRALAGEN